MVKRVVDVFEVEMADGYKQIFPAHCPVYVRVTGRANGIECSLDGFEGTSLLVSVLTYGTLRIPFKDITGITKLKV